MYLKKKTKGFFLIEVIIASAIIGTSLIFILSALGTTLSLAKRGLEETQASYLLEEGAEVVKILRNGAWTNVSIPTIIQSSDQDVQQNEQGYQTINSYYLAWTNGVWTLSNTPQKIGQFTRTITFQSVYRDNYDRISSSGILDPGTSKVTIFVSWKTLNGTRTENLPFYISNITP